LIQWLRILIFLWIELVPEAGPAALDYQRKKKRHPADWVFETYQTAWDD
jgi:hypothetical protein